jgi:hypothetical protein
MSSPLCLESEEEDENIRWKMPSPLYLESEDGRTVLSPPLYLESDEENENIRWQMSFPLYCTLKVMMGVQSWVKNVVTFVP